MWGSGGIGLGVSCERRYRKMFLYAVVRVILRYLC